MEGRDVGDALRRETLGVILAAGGVDHLARLLVAVERPGDRRDRELAVDDGERAGGVGREIDAALRDHLNAHRGVAAGELIVREDVDGHVAAGALGHEVREVAGHAAVDLRVRAVDGHDEIDLLVRAVPVAAALRGRRAARQKHQRQKQREDWDRFANVHVLSSAFSDFLRSLFSVLSSLNVEHWLL